MKRWLLIVVCSMVLCSFGCKPAEKKPESSPPAAGAGEKPADGGNMEKKEG